MIFRDRHSELIVDQNDANVHLPDIRYRYKWKQKRMTKLRLREEMKTKHMQTENKRKEEVLKGRTLYESEHTIMTFSSYSAV